MISLLDPPNQSSTAEETMAQYKRGKEDLSRFVMGWYAELKSNRLIWERLWQEVRELIRPNAEDFTIKVPAAQARKQRIYDDFPCMALQTLSAGVHSNLTNSATRWFAFSTGDMYTDQQASMASWLETCSNMVYDEIYHPKAGFNLASQELYEDWAGFGTGVFHFHEGENHLHFRSVPLAECCISENEYGIVDVLFREFQMTQRAAMMRWPNLPRKVVDGENKEEAIWFIHAIYPIDSDVKFKSVYVHKETGEVVEEGMFEEFPFTVVRWVKIPGDVYGRGPGTDQLQNVRVLNEAVRLMLQSSQLASAPPIIFESDGVLNKVVLQPWGQLMISPGSQFPKALEVAGNIKVNQETIDKLHESIGEAFFNDVFQSTDYGNRDRVTGQEVSVDESSKLRRMSPITGRMEVEHLNILVQRVFNFLMKKGKMPQPPPMMGGKKLKVEYLSPAAQALRAQKAQNNLKFVQTVVPFLQVKPDLLDSIDLDMVMTQAGFAFDVSRSAILPPQQVAMIRQQRAQQQAAQQQAEQATNATQGVLNIAQAQKAAPGMLSQLSPNS